MKLTASTQSKEITNKLTETPIPIVVIRVVFIIYLFLLLVVLPLVFHTGYVDIADTKWKYYKLFTVGLISDYGVMIFPGCAIILIMLFIWYALDKKRNGLVFKKPLVTDFFVIAYMIVCCISAILAPVKTVVLEGYPGYYMGLYAQLSFCMLYLFSSNICLVPSRGYSSSNYDNGKKNNIICKFFLTDLYLEIIPWIIVVFMMVGSTPVMYIGIQNALKRDIFRMAEVSGTEVARFVSTIGNTGIYAEYVTLMLVAGIYVFCYVKKRLFVIVSGMWLILAFIAALCARAMAGAVGVLSILFVFFVLSFRTRFRFMRYMLMFIIMGISFAIMERIAYDEEGEFAVVTDKLMLTVIDKRIWISMIVIGAIIAMVMFIIGRITEENENIKRNRIIPLVLQLIVSVVFVTLIYGVYMYIKMNTEGSLPAWLPASENPNLIFNESWGSNRIDIWKTVLTSYREVNKGDIKLLLFGLGPDNLYILPGMTDLGSRVWGPNSIVAYAHNELINIYVNMGLLGVISYVGVFVSAIVYLVFDRIPKSHADDSFKIISNGISDYYIDNDAPPGRILALAAIFGYLAQGFFGYQWVCVSTIAFILVGAGVARYRK